MLRHLLVVTMLLLASRSVAAPVNVEEQLHQLLFMPLNGAEAPAFSLPSISQPQVALADSRGKWTLLAFWATWCNACAEEMPVLQQLHEGLGSKGLQILTVSIDEGPDSVVREYATSRKLTVPMRRVGS